MWGKDAVPYYLDSLKPDVFITLMDVWVFQELIEVGKHFKWCPYLPIDSSPLCPPIGDTIKTATTIIPFSKFGVQQLEDAGYKNYFYIPHCIDTNMYKKLPDDEIHRLRKEVGIDDKLVFLSVGMNTGFRKGYSRMFRSYRKFLDETKANDTILWCHTEPHPPKRGIALDTIAERLCNLKVVQSYEQLRREDADVIFTPGFGHSRPFSEKRLNELYNIGDVHVLASLGEGFCIPIVESMSAGLPNINTDFSTTEELIGDDRGIRTKVAGYWTSPLACNQAFCSTDSLKDAMLYYYNNRDEIKKQGKRCIEFAKEYSLENVLPKWDEFLSTIKG